MSERIYLDYNATTPMAPEVVAAMSPYLTDALENPSSLHWAGLPARDAVEAARSKVAALLCCDATEIVFTSGGTEANNQAIKGLYYAAARDQGAPFHIITSRIEHPAVLEPCDFLERLGAEVTRLPVDRFGCIDPDDVRRTIWQALQVRFGNHVVLNGHPEQRLPNTLNVGFRGEIGGEILGNMPNVAASTGSACHAGRMHISPVLAEMRVPDDVAYGTVRFSLGRETTRSQIDSVVEILAKRSEITIQCNI